MGYIRGKVAGRQLSGFSISSSSWRAERVPAGRGHESGRPEAQSCRPATWPPLFVMALLPQSFLPETYELYGQLMTISPVKVTAREFQGAFGSSATRRDITWLSLPSRSKSHPRSDTVPPSRYPLLGRSPRMERIRLAWPRSARLPGAPDASLTSGMSRPGSFVTISERFGGRQFLNDHCVPPT